VSEGGRAKKALCCGSLATSADAPLKRAATCAKPRLQLFPLRSVRIVAVIGFAAERLSSSRNLRLSATINAAAAFWWAAIVATIGSRDVLIRYARRWNAIWEEPNMQIIDAQVHAYERNHPGRPWVGHLHGPPSATGDEMVGAMDAVGVDGALLVSQYKP
jgi:hypothetical protein